MPGKLKVANPSPLGAGRGVIFSVFAPFSMLLAPLETDGALEGRDNAGSLDARRSSCWSTASMLSRCDGDTRSSPRMRAKKGSGRPVGRL